MGGTSSKQKTGGPLTPARAVMEAQRADRKTRLMRLEKKKADMVTQVSKLQHNIDASSPTIERLKLNVARLDVGINTLRSRATS